VGGFIGLVGNEVNAVREVGGSKNNFTKNLDKDKIVR
jgi:hypothetical protein